jgi:membrane protein
MGTTYHHEHANNGHRDKFGADKHYKKRGAKETALIVKDQIQDDHLSIIAAGIAFYIFLALFPAIVALLSIYGLVMEPQQVQQQVDQIGMLPEESQQFLSNTLQNLASKSGQSLGWGMALSILISLWSANSGTKALFEGINIAYHDKNSRSFVKENSISLVFTVGAIFILIICLSLIVAFPALAGNLGLPDVFHTIIEWGRWLLLGVIIVFCISAIYRYAPVKKHPRTKWINWGAIVATVLWLIGSWLFSFYVSNFGNYDEMYGPAAAIVVLMLWFFLSCLFVLIGAELNAVLENRTRDTVSVERVKEQDHYPEYVVDKDNT